MDRFQVLKHYFGYDAFRQGQDVLIEHLLNGEDVVGIMPTGAGKSICFHACPFVFRANIGDFATHFFNERSGA